MIMIIKRLYFIATVLFAFSVCSCGGENYPDHPWEWDQDTEEEDPSIQISREFSREKGYCIYSRCRYD